VKTWAHSAKKGRFSPYRKGGVVSTVRKVKERGETSCLRKGATYRRKLVPGKVIIPLGEARTVRGTLPFWRGHTSTTSQTSSPAAREERDRGWKGNFKGNASRRAPEEGGGCGASCKLRSAFLCQSKKENGRMGCRKKSFPA